MNNNEKDYTFSITLNIEASIPAESEEEARSKLTEVVQDYFAETTVEISDKEAQLIHTNN